MRGDTGGMVRYANTPKQGEERIWGDLLKFTNIDAEGKWLDLATGEVAEPEDVERRVVIPPTYRPNLHSVPYIFFPKKHRLLFMSRYDQRNTLSPGMAKTLVERFLNRSDLVEKHGAAKVTVEPDRETLKRIFAIPTLRAITLEVAPPNALGDIERQLLRFLADQNATRYTQELATGHPDGLQLSQTTRRVAEVAQSNGHVTARGLDENGRAVQFSTANHPYEERIEFNPGVTNPTDLFDEVSSQILREISRPVDQRD
ncbi:DUF4747 family protein [Massilia sp. MB5]|uniref:DUF4747 family protein n=1 Tax=Massilia sp. MB5 TaxID=2919578 RepID=UPI001F0ED539|nr:DUF4747 family protein [Massilia sp. MB5]UMR31993.1 DUF4747 family protein [Massilia sp. MB5]